MRIDTGVDEGSTISMFYDPLISKLITYGETRGAALANMARALDAYVIRGLGHNLAFLCNVVRHPTFAGGRYATDFIIENYPRGFTGVALTPRELSHLATYAATVHCARVARDRTLDGQISCPAEPDLGELVVVLSGPKGTPYTVR